MSLHVFKTLQTKKKKCTQDENKKLKTTQMTNRHVKICSISLSYREM